MFCSFVYSHFEMHLGQGKKWRKLFVPQSSHPIPSHLRLGLFLIQNLCCNWICLSDWGVKNMTIWHWNFVANQENLISCAFRQKDYPFNLIRWCAGLMVRNLVRHENLFFLIMKELVPRRRLDSKAFSYSGK